jgi:hypothetical protein
MDDRGEAVRRAVASLGKRGRTTRVPERVRERALAYAVEQRRRGVSWQAIATRTGLSASALQRWAARRGKRRAQRTLLPVQLRAAASERPTSVVLVSPRGFRLEGLRVEDAMRLLGELG